MAELLFPVAQTTEGAGAALPKPVSHLLLGSRLLKPSWSDLTPQSHLEITTVPFQSPRHSLVHLKCEPPGQPQGS